MIHGSTDVTKLVGAAKSRWRYNLQQFGEEVLIARRRALGLTQGQMAERVGLNQSTVSRIERGSAPKDYPTAKSVAITYKLTGAETDNWFRLLANPVEHNDEWMVLKVDDLIERLKKEVSAIRVVRLEGNPYRAIQMAADHSFWLKEVEVKSPPRYQNLIRRLRMSLLLDQATAYREISAPNEVVQRVKPILDEARDIAVDDKDYEVVGSTYTAWGDTYLVARDYGASIKMLEQAKELVNEPNDRLSLLRTLILAWAHLEEKQNASRTESEMNTLLDSASVEAERACEACEGVALSYAMLKSTEGLPYLKQCESFISKLGTTNVKMPLRVLQVARTRFRTIVLEHDRRLLESEGTRVLTLATEFPYTRHTAEVQKLLVETID